jgi:HSP20 family protein
MKMNLVRFDPFRDMSALQTRVNRLFNDVLAGGADLETRGWSPVVDIFERGEDLVLRAEVPGVSRDKLDVSVENNVLTIRGERERDREIKEEHYHRVERSYGVFSRSFTLPATVDATKIAAQFKEGILEVVLPKAEAAKPKRISIEAS